ncbi:hypothetical protein V8E53_007486 [Lactarius tabidus]
MTVVTRIWLGNPKTLSVSTLNPSLDHTSARTVGFKNTPAHALAEWFVNSKRTSSFHTSTSSTVTATATWSRPPEFHSKYPINWPPDLYTDGKTGDFPHPADYADCVRTLTLSFNSPPTPCQFSMHRMNPAGKEKLGRMLGSVWAEQNFPEASLGISVAVDGRRIFRIDVYLASNTPTAGRPDADALYAARSGLPIVKTKSSSIAKSRSRKGAGVLFPFPSSVAEGAQEDGPHSCKCLAENENSILELGLKFIVSGKVNADFALSKVDAFVGIAYSLSEVAATFAPQSSSIGGSFN